MQLNTCCKQLLEMVRASLPKTNGNHSLLLRVDMSTRRSASLQYELLLRRAPIISQPRRLNHWFKYTCHRKSSKDRHSEATQTLHQGGPFHLPMRWQAQKLIPSHYSRRRLWGAECWTNSSVERGVAAWFRRDVVTLLFPERVAGVLDAKATTSIAFQDHVLLGLVDNVSIRLIQVRYKAHGALGHVVDDDVLEALKAAGNQR